MTEFSISAIWTDDQLRIIKSIIAPDLTDDELVVFAQFCKQTNLNPLTRQIYAIKRGGRMTIQTSIDGFRVVAERTGRYSPGKDTELLYSENNRLMGAKVYVKKQTQDGTWHDISATAFISEYSTGKGFWQKMPSVMIEKCAEARALRRAFPSDLDGIYTQEEMDQADTDRSLPETLSNEKISADKATEMLKYLEGNDSLKKEVLMLCKVDSVEDILESQLEACRKYIKAKNKKKETVEVEDEN